MKSRKKRLREVYVWELPVRIYHWLNALCIVILCITGFIIADPLAIMTETEANFSLLVRHGTLHSLRGSVCVFLQFRVPPVLGVRREPIYTLE